MCSRTGAAIHFRLPAAVHVALTSELESLFSSSCGTDDCLNVGLWGRRAMCPTTPCCNHSTDIHAAWCECYAIGVVLFCYVMRSWCELCASLSCWSEGSCARDIAGSLFYLTGISCLSLSARLSYRCSPHAQRNGGRKWWRVDAQQKKDEPFVLKCRPQDGDFVIDWFKNEMS